MRIGFAIGLAGIALTSLQAGCAPVPLPVVKQSVALGGGARSIALAPTPPELPAALIPDRSAVERDLKQAGYMLQPSAAGARYLLVVTVAGAARRIGTLLPAAEDAPARPIQWIARPPRGIGASFAPASVIRVSALVIDAASGHELWRATISAPVRDRPDQATMLTTRLLAELPRG